MDEENVLPEWAKEGLPEALHDMPFLKETGDAAEFKNKLVHAAQHMGNSVRIPGPDATEEVWSEFHTKLGEKVPNLHHADVATEDGQKAMLKMLGLPEDAAGYDAGDKHMWLAQAAHDAGLTINQFKGLVDKLGDVNKTRQEETSAEMQAGLDALFTEWGLAKPGKIDNINGLLKLTNAPEELTALVTDGKAPSETIKWLDSIASQFAEVSKFKKDRNDPQTITPGEAQLQIQELMENPEFFKTGPASMELRKRMLELQKAANPQASTNIRDLQADDSMFEVFDMSG